MFEWQEDFESGQLRADTGEGDQYWICDASLVHVTFDSAGPKENWIGTGNEEYLKAKAVAHHSERGNY